MSSWIDFKELRKQLDFEAVLKHYGVEIKRKGKQHHGFCPLPNHNGKRNSPSFSANLERGIFQCFGCGAKGNALEFAALMENVDPQDGSALREIALKLRQHVCSDLGPTSTEPKEPSSVKREPQAMTKSGNQLPTLVNMPLDFELKGLDAKHPYLLSRGFTAETIGNFGLGFCSRGLLKDRMAIPLYDSSGALIGYAGRVVDDNAINEDNPRYKFPGERKRDGRTFEFRKTQFLYNGHRIGVPVDDLIVVEGFTSVWWLAQNGLPSAVATMGADCSQRQAELIVSLLNPVGRVWIIPDGDPAGERHAQTLLLLLSPHRFVRWVNLAAGRQPTDYTGAELKQLLGR